MLILNLRFLLYSCSVSVGNLSDISSLLISPTVYAAYLIFQLWSHSYLYDDRHNETSTKFRLRRFELSTDLPQSGRQHNTVYGYQDPSVDNLSVLVPPRPFYSQPGASGASSSQLTLTTPTAENYSEIDLHEPTVKLVRAPGGYPMNRFESGFTSTATTKVGNEHISNQEKNHSTSGQRGTKVMQELNAFSAADIEPAPQVSWVLAVVLLVVVTIVRALTLSYIMQLMGFAISRQHL